MARQTGAVKFTGTYGNVTCYEMEGKHYARKKSSLTGERVKKDPAFRWTMIYANWLAKASKIASVVYNSLPEETREHKQFRTMTGIAMKMLKADTDPGDIVDHLIALYTPPELSRFYVARTGKLRRRGPRVVKCTNKKAAPVSRSSFVAITIENSS